MALFFKDTPYANETMLIDQVKTVLTEDNTTALVMNILVQSSQVFLFAQLEDIHVSSNYSVYRQHTPQPSSQPSSPSSQPSSSVPSTLPSALSKLTVPSSTPTVQSTEAPSETSLQVIVVTQTDISRSMLYVALILAILSSFATITFFVRARWRKVEAAPLGNDNDVEGGFVFDSAFTAREGPGANDNQTAMVQVKTTRSGFLGGAFESLKDIMPRLKSKRTIQPSTSDNENVAAISAELAQMTALYEESQRELKALRVGESTGENELIAHTQDRHIIDCEQDLKTPELRASVLSGAPFVEDASEDDSGVHSDNDSIENEIQTRVPEKDMETANSQTKSHIVSGGGGNSSSIMGSNSVRIHNEGDKIEEDEDGGKGEYKNEREYEGIHEIVHRYEYEYVHKHKDSDEDKDMQTETKTNDITSKDLSNNGDHRCDGDKNDRDHDESKIEIANSTPSKVLRHKGLDVDSSDLDASIDSSTRV